MLYISPDQRVDVGSTMQAGFNIDLTQDEVIGVLMYRLQRRNTDQSDEGTMSSEDASYIQLVMIWKVNRPGEFLVVSDLVEHDKGHIWSRDMLMGLTNCYGLFNIRHGPIENTWLMCDHKVLMTSLNMAYEKECYKLEMTTSETSVKDDTRMPWYIDLDK
jgi:hypothetical protein